jgi:4-hydroxy-tetrahydrodipicolinate synthase
MALANPATWLTGYIPDLPIPFDNNDESDFAAFAKLCEHQIEASVPAIVVGETAGETSNLGRTRGESYYANAPRL